MSAATDFPVRGVDLIELRAAAPMLGTSPAALFQAGCKGRITLVRTGSCWSCDLSEAQAFVDQCRAEERAQRAALERIAAQSIKARKAKAATA